MNIFTKNQWLMAMGLAASLSMAGCAKKPPSCSDSETVKTINAIIQDNVKERMPLYFGIQNLDDPQKTQDTYYQALKGEMANVVSDGYNEQAKKYSCRGHLTASTLSGEKFEGDIAYTTQHTEDKNNDFLVEVQLLQPLISALGRDLSAYYLIKRFQGEWKGQYSCAGIDNATDGAQGPFAMPVTLVVDDRMQATMERTTHGGGIERLAGSMGPGVSKLAGEGKNSPDDTWLTSFEGAAQGFDFAAQGKIVTPDGRLLRQCLLKLKLPS